MGNLKNEVKLIKIVLYVLLALVGFLYGHFKII